MTLPLKHSLILVNMFIIINFLEEDFGDSLNF